MADERTRQDEAFQQALIFDADDLAHNRIGQLSAAQVTRLRVVLRRKKVANVCYLLVLALVGWYYFIRSDSWKPWVVLISVGVIWFLLVDFLAQMLEVHERDITHVEGEGERTDPNFAQTNPRNTRLYFYVEVAGRRFQVPQGAYESFVDGQIYRIYFLRRTSRIMALERLDQPLPDSTSP